MRVRNHYLIKAISRRYAVSLLTLAESEAELAHLDALRPYCVSVDAVVATVLDAASTRWASPLPGAWQAAPHAPAGVSGDARQGRRARRTLGRAPVQIEHSYMAHYLQALPPAYRCRTILEFPDLGSVQYGRMLRLRISPQRKARYLWEWWTA